MGPSYWIRTCWPTSGNASLFLMSEFQYVDRYGQMRLLQQLRLIDPTLPSNNLTSRSGNLVPRKCLLPSPCGAAHILNLGEQSTPFSILSLTDTSGRSFLPAPSWLRGSNARKRTSCIAWQRLPLIVKIRVGYRTILATGYLCIGYLRWTINIEAW